MAVRVQRLASNGNDARLSAIIFEMDFLDQAALEACLASAIRPESHAATEAVMRMLESRFHQLVSEARTLPLEERAEALLGDHIRDLSPSIGVGTVSCFSRQASGDLFSRPWPVVRWMSGAGPHAPSTIPGLRGRFNRREPDGIEGRV